MHNDDIYNALNETFADIFMRDNIVLTPDTMAKDVDGWDSFKMIEIIMAVQDRFGIKLHTRELDSLKNVGDLVKVIASKRA